MGVDVRTTEAGDGINKPKSGDTVRLWHIGYIYDEEMPDKKGRQFEATESRKKDFETVLGQGNNIRGFEEGILQMSIGEKATLTMTSDYGYGERENAKVNIYRRRGFPGLIASGADLVFDVKLIAISSMKAEKEEN